jgi:hypothetical protein
MFCGCLSSVLIPGCFILLAVALKMAVSMHLVLSDLNSRFLRGRCCHSAGREEQSHPEDIDGKLRHFLLETVAFVRSLGRGCIHRSIDDVRAHLWCIGS